MIKLFPLLILLLSCRPETKVTTPEVCWENKKVQISGVSMEPLLKNGSIVELQKGYYQCQFIHRGDIITFDLAAKKIDVIKRLVAIPGDLVRFTKKGFLEVEKRIVKNSIGIPYKLNKKQMGQIHRSVHRETLRVKEGYFLVLSDNVNNFFDSRRFGPIYSSMIKGKVLIK